MQSKLFAVLFFALLTNTGSLGARHATARSAAVIVDCRVLESHVTAVPPVIAVVFHQRDAQDQPRFAALLKQNSGATVAVQMAQSPWVNGTVVRLKSCFGRGLLLLPPGSLAIKDGAAFRVKFSESAAAD